MWAYVVFVTLYYYMLHNPLTHHFVLLSNIQKETLMTRFLNGNFMFILL